MSASPEAIYAHVLRWLEQQRRAAGIDDADAGGPEAQECGGPCPAFVAAIHEQDWIDPTPERTRRLEIITEV